MILGVKCEACKRWTRISGLPENPGNIFLVHDAINSFDKPYYCDECETNVTIRESRVKISWK